MYKFAGKYLRVVAHPAHQGAIQMATSSPSPLDRFRNDEDVVCILQKFDKILDVDRVLGMGAAALEADALAVQSRVAEVAATLTWDERMDFDIVLVDFLTCVALSPMGKSIMDWALRSGLLFVDGNTGNIVEKFIQFVSSSGMDESDANDAFDAMFDWFMGFPEVADAVESPSVAALLKQNIMRQGTKHGIEKVLSVLPVGFRKLSAIDVSLAFTGITCGVCADLDRAAVKFVLQRCVEDSGVSTLDVLNGAAATLFLHSRRIDAAKVLIQELFEAAT